MSLDTNDLQDTFVRIINPLTQGLMIAAEDDGPRPSKSEEPNGFTTIKVASIVELGKPQYSDVDPNTGEQPITMWNELVFSIQSFGPNAKSRLQAIRRLLRKSTVLGALRSENLYFKGSTDILDITAFLETDWEERGQINLTFNITDCFTDDVGIIESTEIQGTHVDCGGSIRFVQNINVTTTP